MQRKTYPPSNHVCGDPRDYRWSYIALRGRSLVSIIQNVDDGVVTAKSSYMTGAPWDLLYVRRGVFVYGTMACHVSAIAVRGPTLHYLLPYSVLFEQVRDARLGLTVRIERGRRRNVYIDEDESLEHLRQDSVHAHEPMPGLPWRLAAIGCPIGVGIGG